MQTVPNSGVLERALQPSDSSKLRSRTQVTIRDDVHRLTNELAEDELADAQALLEALRAPLEGSGCRSGSGETDAKGASPSGADRDTPLDLPDSDA